MALSDPGMLLTLGKVVRVYPDSRRADVMLLSGGLLKKVPVVGSIAGSHEGSAYLPAVGAQTGETSMAPTGTDTYCVVGNLAGDIRKPVVLGLLFPGDFETAFTDIDVNKHLGGSYAAFDPDGFEINRPDGTYVRVGTTTARIVDSKTNTGSVPFSRTTGTAVGAPHVYIKHSSGTTIDIGTTGLITITKAAGGSFELTNHTHSDPQGGSTGIPQ